MNNLDKLLRSARPSVPELPEDFDRLVMDRIETEGIAILEQDAGFLTKRIRIVMGLLALLAALILFNYNSYELQTNGSLELLYFGTSYLFDFLTFLPWDLIIASLLLTTFSVWMIGKSRVLKKGIAVTAIISYLITGIGGVALAATGINEKVEAGITQNENRWPWLKLFHNQRANEFIHHPNFRMGKVEEISNGSAVVATPHGDKIRIQLPENIQVQAGQVLRMSGTGNDTVFSAQRVHICNPNRVMHYFGHRGGHQKMMRSCCGNKGMMMR